MTEQSHPSPRPALVAGLVGAVVLAVLLVAVAGAKPFEVVGAADPGVVVRLAIALTRVVADLSGTLTIGYLAFALFFTQPQRNGLMSPRAYRAVIPAGRWAIAWALSALAMVPLSVFGLTGEPVGRVLANFGGPLRALGAPKSWLIAAVLALGVVIGTRIIVRWRAVAVVLMTGVAALLPPLSTGHSAADVDHDWGTTALLIHVPAAALWLGTLVPLIGELRRGSTDVAVLARRQARMGLACAGGVVASGLISAAVLIRDPADLVRTQYGATVLAVAAATVAVIVLLARRPSTPTVGHLLARTALLLLIVGASASTAELAPPSLGLHTETIYQTLIGFDLHGAPTALRLALDWRIDVLFAPLCVVLASVYLLGLRRASAAGLSWPRSRTVSWLAGCALLLIATSSGLGRYEPAMFSVHMASHMLISMFVPLLLVQGAPLTLAAAVLRPAADDAPYGPREWIQAAGSSAIARTLTNPFSALILFTGAPLLLYFTPLYDAAARYHWAHLLLDIVFLLIGYVFVWTVVGVDPIPRPLPNLARLGLLLASAPVCTVFGALVFTTTRVIGNGVSSAAMYSALGLPWVSSLLADQRIAGVIALVAGDGMVFAAVLVLLVRWSRVDSDSAEADIANPASLLAERIQQRL